MNGPGKLVFVPELRIISRSQPGKLPETAYVNDSFEVVGDVEADGKVRITRPALEAGFIVIDKWDPSMGENLRAEYGETP